MLDQYAGRFFPADLRLVDVQPQHLSRFVGWLADPRVQGRELSESTMKNAVMPIRAALATARADGLIRFNPADGLRFPKRDAIREDEDEQVKALSREQLAALLAMAPGRYSLLIEFVAATGVRISEAIALQRRHLLLDGSSPHVRIRRAIVKGEVSPPKSRHGRRQVALSAALVSKLRRHLLDVPDGDDAIVFASLAGTPLDPDNIRSRVLKPLYEEIGAPSAGWHTLRHTFASLQIVNGANIVQLSRVLGHHSPSFTLSTYAHLLPGEGAPALDLDDALWVNSRINTPHVERPVKAA